MIPLRLKKKIREGDMYAVQTGDYVGEMWTFIKESLRSYEFLATPKMENRSTPKDKFDIGKDNAIIEYVETVPRDIFQVIKRQWEDNEKRLRSS